MSESIEFVLEVSLPAIPALRERVDAELYLSDSTGSLAREAEDAIVVTAWFSDAEARERAIQRLGIISDLTLSVQDREPTDWLEHYEQSLVAMEIGERFIVAPDPRLLVDVRDRIPLIVPQERAFGTGSHATTSMCLELLEDAAAAKRRGIDVGTGSGILAIAMQKLGCASVFAFDNDSETLGVVRDNLRRNGMSPTAIPHFVAGVEAVRGSGFDLVTMNIVPEVIIPLLPQVRRLLASDATIILSGILEERADEVIDAAGMHGLRLEAHRRNGEWWAGLFTV